MTIVKRAPNATYVKAEGALGRWGEFQSTTLDDVWGRLERFHQDRQGVNSDELDELAERIVTQQTTQTAGRVVQLADPVLLPWTAYEPGDTVNLNLSPKDVKGDKRVAAIVVSKGPQDAVPKYDVHFGSPVYSNDTAIVQGLKTLIREFKRPTYNPPAGATLPDIPPPLSGAGTPTIVIAASNATTLSQGKADLICGASGAQTVLANAINILKQTDFGGRILLTEGDFNFSAACTLTSTSPDAISYRIEGMGVDATRINMSAAANAHAFHLDNPIDGTVEFSNLTINGAKATQTSGTWAGIYLEPNGGGRVWVDHCFIHDFRGYGIWSDRSASSLNINDSRIGVNSLSGIDLGVEGNFIITNNHIYGNTEYGILGAGDNITLIGNWIYSNTLDGYGTGGIFNTSGIRINIVGNRFYSNRNGLFLNGAAKSTVVGNIFYANTTHGADIQTVASNPVVIQGNIAYVNTQNGFTLSGGGGGAFNGNMSGANGRHGISVTGDDWNINGNRVESNGTTTNNTYDGIVVLTGAGDCAILNNVIRQDASANKQRYGLNIQAGAVNTFAAGNDARGGGFVTGAFVDAGTTSVLAWAGGFGDNQP